MKILNVVWVSGPTGVIGMVMVENKAGVRKVYVGPGTGADEDADIQLICNWSGKLHPVSIQHLFEHFGGEVNSDEDWNHAIHDLRGKYNETDYPNEPQTEDVFDSMDLKQQQYVRSAAGFTARDILEKLIAAVIGYRDVRKKATGDRPEPDKHPAAGKT